jgi:hypothetical protein
MSQLRAISILASATRSPLWRADLAVAYAGPDPRAGPSRPVVQKTHAVRVLVQSAVPEDLVVDNQPYPFHRPRLLVAAVEPRGDEKSLWAKLTVGLGGANEDKDITLLDIENDLNDVVVAPAEPHGVWPVHNDEIEVPQFALVAGQIRIWLKLRKLESGQPVTEEPWFGYRKVNGEDRLFCSTSRNDGLRAFTCKRGDETWLPVVLSEDGITFLAKVPDPRQAFTGQARQIWAWVQVSQAASGRKPRYFVRFVEACKEPVCTGDWAFPAPEADPDYALEVERDLHGLFRASRLRFDIQIDFDDRPSVPPFRWEMRTRPDSSRPLFPQIQSDWSVQFDPALFRVNILSTIDGNASTASLRCDRASLNIAPVGPKSLSNLTLESTSNATKTRLLQLSRKASERSWSAIKPDPATFSTGRLELRNVSERLKAIYRASGVYDGDEDGAVQAFLPVQHGWMQLPLLETESLPDVPGLKDPVMIGDAAFVLDRARGFAIEIGQASSGKIVLSIGQRPSDACPQIDLAFDDISGRLRGLVHVADCSPAHGEILPTLRQGATREWPIRFGAGPGEGFIKAATDIGRREVEIDTAPRKNAGLEGSGLGWLREGAWISTINFAQSTGSGLPVAARSYVPRKLKRVSKLRWDTSSVLPRVDPSSLGDAWELFASDPGVTQFLPSLAGIERHQLLDDFSYTLRHDLPPLDDLNAGMELDDTPLLLLGEKADPGQAKSTLATAAAPKRLEEAWRKIRNNARLTQTRLRAAFVQAKSGSKVDVEGLAEPYIWPQVDFQFEPNNQSGLPLGAFFLGNERFEAETALAGLNLPGLELEYRGQKRKIPVTGNATPRWRTTARSHMMHDVTGIGLDERASLDRPVELLNSATTEFRLRTLPKPVQLADGVNFWFRDLPVTSAGVFDGEDGPDQLGSSTDRWSQESFARSLYEWRIWAVDVDPSTSDQKDPRMSGDIPLSLGYTARPLRLRRVEITAGKVALVEIIASVMAPLSLDASGASEAGITGPARNLVLLTYALEKSSAYVRRIRRIRIEDGQIVPDNSAGAGESIVSFDIEPTIFLGDAKDGVTRPAALQLVIREDGNIWDVRLSMTLFGQRLDFEPKSIGEDATDVSIDFRMIGPETAGKLEVQHVALRWSKSSDPLVTTPPELQAWPSVRIPFAVKDDTTHIEIDLSNGRIEWFGTTVTGVLVQMSVDDPEIRFVLEDTTSLTGPIRGLTFDKVLANGLFCVAADRTISGMFQLEARRKTVGKTIFASRLRHSFLFTTSGWQNSLDLNFEGEGTSSLRWPLDVSTPPKPDPSAELIRPFTVSVNAGAALCHYVRCTVESASVPLAHLTAKGVLETPWYLPIRADHRLEGADGRRATWTTLDEVCLVDLERLTSQPTSYGFGARYRGSYRGQSISGAPERIGGGIFQRALVAAGFPDSLMLEAIGKKKLSGLVMTGAGATLFQMGNGLENGEAPDNPVGGESILLAMPWLIGFEAARLGPFDTLNQAPANGVRAWSTAWFDSRPAAFRASARIVPLALGKPSSKLIAKQIARTLPGPVDFSMAAVEQSFFETVEKVELSETLLFLRSVVVLSQYWNRLAAIGDLQARISQPIVRGDGTAILFAPSLKVAPRKVQRKTWAVGLHSNQVKLCDLKTDMGLDGSDVTSRGVMRSLRDTLDPDALVFGLMAVEDDGGTETGPWEGLSFSTVTIGISRRTSPTDMIGMRDKNDELFAASSLGWPENPLFDDEPEPIALGDNMPFQRAEAALAGRIASYAVAADAPPEGSPWLTHRHAAVFAAAALPDASGPAPRHQDVVPRRQRLPIVDVHPTIMPGRFVIATMGRKPGTVYADAVALKSAGTAITSIEGKQLAYRSALHTVVGGVDRMPRATVFPANVVDLDWRRETFVVGSDRKCRLDQVPAVSFRTYPTNADGRNPGPDKLVTLRLATASLALASATEIELIIDGPMPSEGWAPYRWHEFRFRVGDRYWPLGRHVENGPGRISLPITPMQSEEALEAARRSTGDTIIACELQVAANAPNASGLTAAPALLLRLPVAIAEHDEPQLDLRQSTVTFGDPAYDRMLSSMCVSDSRRIGAALLILAADREAYDQTTPILFGLARQEPNGSVTWPGFDVTISWTGGGPNQSFHPIRASGGVSALTLDEIARKLGIRGFAPGDRFSISARYEDPATSAITELGLELGVAREPVVPPAPAIYHLLTRHGPGGADAATALSASGPRASVIEYASLEQDLLSGYLRRRGLFTWYFTPDVDPQFDRFGYLIKIDRSGAAQMPKRLEDFEPAEKISVAVPIEAARSAWR